MTLQLYFTEMYKKEFDATVMDAYDNNIILDQTLFYPTSGGQPNDTGIIKFNDKNIEITDVRKDGNNILHITDSSTGIKNGDKIHGMINWDKRYLHMRYHTAVHIIDGVVSNEYKNGLLTGGQIYDDHARVDFSFDIIDKELINDIIKKSNEVINRGLNVFQRDITRDEALKIPELSRTEPGRELIKKLDRVRIIEIENFDYQADGGTHVKNTQEVGKIEILKIENKGRGHKRLSFKLN